VIRGAETGAVNRQHGHMLWSSLGLD